MKNRASRLSLLTTVVLIPLASATLVGGGGDAYAAGSVIYMGPVRVQPTNQLVGLNALCVAPPTSTGAVAACSCDVVLSSFYANGTLYSSNGR